MFEVIKQWLANIFSFETKTFYVHGKKLKVIKKIGEGGFSFVYLVKSSDYSTEDKTTSLFALKRIKVQLDDQERAFERELHYYNLIVHKNVITLLDGEITRGSEKEGLLLFPYYRNGTVQDLINHNYLNHTRIPLDQIIRIFEGICNGIMSFHLQNPVLAFRDLKPDNVLLDSSGNAILMDLGSVELARFEIKSRKDALALQDLCAETVTNQYRPPEFFEVPGNYFSFDERTDVWSLGCTLYAMAYHTSPFDGTATSALGRVNFPADGTYDQIFRDFILVMLNTELHKRPFVSDILNSLQRLKS